MRILVLSAWYPPHHLGGYELAAESAVRGLRERGHELRVLTSRFETANGQSKPDEARRELNLFWEDGRWLRPGLRGAIRAAREDLDAFGREIDAFEPDLLWVWHMAGVSKVLLSEAYARRLPYVLSFLDVWPIYDLPPDPWLRWCRGARAPLGRAIGLARGLPSRSPALAEDAADASYCSAWLQRVLAGQGHAPEGRVIYPGIDPARFPAAPPSGRPVRRFLQVGRVEPRKGPAIAVEALAKLHAAGYADATLTLAGSAERGHDEELRTLAARLGIGDAVRLTGPVSHDDLPRVYAVHDAAIHAATWHEPFGLVLVEALASGRPLVCSPTGGAQEIVTPGVDALTFEAGDTAACAAQMEALAADPALAGRMVEAGLRTAARFTEDRAAAEHEAQLLEVLGRGDAPPRVSVIVPVRDRRELLLGTIEALRAQTYPAEAFEVLVVDDGSTDGTPEAAERAAGSLDLRVERRPASGAVAARNHGASVARGEVLAFTDSDCRPAPGWLAAAVSALEAADAIQGLTVADPAMHRGPLHRTVEAGGGSGLFDSCNLAVRAEAFRAVGGFDAAFARRIRVPRSTGQIHYGFGEDTDLGWRMIRAGLRLEFEPRALVHHHVFPPDLRESIGRMWLVGAFPSLVREFPELRERLLKHRVFLTEDRPYVWLALAGVWLARRRPAALALALPYAYRKVARGHGGRRDRVRALPAQALLDAVATAGLVVGSVRARRVVL